MDTSNRRPQDRGRVNSVDSTSSRDIYSNSSAATDDSRDIITQNRRDFVLTAQPVQSAPNPPRKADRHRKRKKHIFPKLLISLLTVVLVMVCLFQFYGRDWINTNLLNTHSFTDDDERLGILESGRDALGITNIALFGLDTRTSGEFADDGSRSDSIMILSIDKNHHKIKVSSIMRDSAVHIEQSGVSSKKLYKINSAYNFGGPELAVKTLNEQLGLNIREYATVDFSNMQHIIDAVGGVDVEITDDERIHLNGTIMEQCELQGIEDYESYFVTETGTVHMNGMQAVAFARVRYVPTVTGEANDYGRTDRQRLVMERLFEKAIQLDSLSMISLGTQLAKYVETSLDIDDILSLSGILLRSDIAFEQARYPRQEDLVGNGDIWISDIEVALNVDWDSIRDSIQSFIYDDIPLDEQGDGKLSTDNY